MGEGPGVIMERGVGGARGYDFEGGGVDLQNLCGQGGQSWRRENRVGGRGKCDGVGNIMVQSSI